VYTYQFTSSNLPDVFCTLMLDHLTAQRHFLMNAVFKYKELSAEQKRYIRKSPVIKFSGDTYAEEAMMLIKSSELEKYGVFTKSFRGATCPVDLIIAWASEITKSYQSTAICLRMTQTRPDMIPMELGIRIRPALGFERKVSPISMSTVEGKQPWVHAYLMLIGFNEML
jgi:hypothetical protein